MVDMDPVISSFIVLQQMLAQKGNKRTTSESCMISQILGLLDYDIANHRENLNYSSPSKTNLQWG